MFKSYIKVLAKLLGNFFPAGTVATFFGIGYFPTWQPYWAAFVSLSFGYLAFFLLYGLDYISYDLPQLSFALSILFLKLSLLWLICCLVSIFLFHAKNADESSSTVIVIHCATGQLLLAALTMPATSSIYEYFVIAYNSICKDVFTCSPWINSSMYFSIFFIIPFIFYSFIHMLKLWPISYLQLNHNNALSIIAEAFTELIYAFFLMYLTSFILFQLTFLKAMDFFSNIFLYFTDLTPL